MRNTMTIKMITMIKKSTGLGARSSLAALVLATTLAVSGLVGLDLVSPYGHAAPRGRTVRPAPAASAEEKGAPVNINTADLDQLTTLPGIGKSIAQRIIDYRKEHGPFKSVDELLGVRGIGERSLSRIKDRVTIATKD